MSRKNKIDCSIWLTVNTDNPDFEDIAKVRWELEKLGIPYEGKVGVAFTQKQWCKFKENASRFELRFLLSMPDQVTVLGFPVKIIQEV